MDTRDSDSARILIVDDHPNTASMLARVLKHLDTPLEVITARSGPEALDLVGNAGVDVVIADFIMPGMNGLDLIENLRKQCEPAHTILITAYPDPALDFTIRHQKVDDYIVKPVEPEKIKAIVSQVVEGLNLNRPLAASANTAQQFKILVADDRPDNVQLLSKRLESGGYRFITAVDGEQTLAAVRSELPDLVLLDVNMPKKDGFEVLAEMRADPAIAHIPVIVITAARTQARDIRQGLGLGADDYVTKPFDWRELAARIQSKLRAKQAEDTLRRRNRELGLLPEIGRDLSARLDVRELTEVILERTVAAWQASNGHLVVFQPDGSLFHKLHTPHESAPWTQEEAAAHMVSEGLVAQVATTRRGAIIEDTNFDERWLSWPNDLARSAVVVPLQGRRSVIGVLTLTHEQPGYFNRDHLMILQAVASQASIAIENAQHYAIEQQRVAELVALNQLTRDLGNFSRSEALFDRVPALIQSALGYPIVSLWLQHDAYPPRAGAELVLHRLAGAKDDLAPEVLARAPQQVATTGRHAILPGSIREAQREPIADLTLPSAAEHHSALAVPIPAGDGMGGVLAIHSPRANAFQESDRVVLQTLAAQIATALERIRLFESVEREQRRLRAVLHGAADAILMTDNHGCVQVINPAGQRLFTDVDTKLGQPLPAGQGYDDLNQLLDQARHTAATVQGEIAWPDARTFAAHVTPLEEGGLVALMYDVTHFKDLERVKDEFIATASHDLKSPITSILGYSHLVKVAGPLNEKQASYVQWIESAGRQMNELVQNLLALAQIDMGMERRNGPVNLAALLQEVTDEFQAQAQAKQLTLAVACVDEPAVVMGDDRQVRQVLRNLMSNAIKYTPDGGEVTIGADRRSPDLLVHVQDTGLGIPAADLPYIFDKFYRVHSNETRDVEGNGLGLAIVKSIVEQHGGQVTVESAVGEGTTFLVRLPLASTGRDQHADPAGTPETPPVT